jgi:hypothetical protein
VSDAPLNNNSQVGGSQDAIQGQPLTTISFKTTLSSRQSNSQPNLLSSFSETDIGPLECAGVATPWYLQEHHSNPRTPDHRHQRSFQTPSQISRPGLGAGYRNLSYDHTSTRRGSIDPSVITNAQSLSTSSRQDHPRRFSLPQRHHHQQQQPKLKVQVGPRLKPTTQPQDPISIVLQYSSELIAQQLCLIEREMLSQVQWYELVDAGWTKKSSASTPSLSTKASLAASSHREMSKRSHRSSVASSIQINEVSLAVSAVQEGGSDSGAGVGVGVGAASVNNRRDSMHEMNAMSEGTVTPTPQAGASLKESTTEQHQEQPYQQTKVEETSLGIKRLVDRFNLASALMSVSFGMLPCFSLLH